MAQSASTVEAPERQAYRSPPTSGWRYTFSSLENRDFRHLWFGLLCMMGGMQMQTIAQGFLVWEETRSAGLVGLVSAAGAMPILGLALFGGAVADRLERKRLIQVGQVVATAIALFVGLSITTGTLTWYHLLGAALLQGVMWSFMAPARQALIPQLVGRHMISNAMALAGAGFSATIVVAPALGGLLYAVLGPQGVYYVVAGLGLMAVLFTNSLPRIALPERSAGSSMLGDIGAGLTYIRHSSLLMALLLVGVATVLLAVPFRLLLPVFVGEVYHRESEAFGLLISMMGLGSLLGALLFASIGRWRRGLLLIGASFVSGVALLLLAAIPHYYPAIGIMVILGFGDAGRRVVNQALVMEQVEDQYQGRVMSVMTMSFGIIPLGVIPVGLAMEVLEGQTVAAILGGAVLATATVVLLTQKGLRELQ